MIQAKFGLNWPNGFRGEDFWKSLQTDDRGQVMAIAHTGELKNRYSTFLKENPKFVYRRLLWVKLSAKTKSLNKDSLKQSFEIICPTFTTRFKFDNYFYIFLDLL